MLARRAEIEPEPDEASILSSLFSTKEEDPSDRAAPYDIDHRSAYEPDATTYDTSTLLSDKIACGRFGKQTYYSTPTLYNVPTIWHCVKKAFTMSSI